MQMYKKVLVPMALDHDVSPRTLTMGQTLAGEGGEVIALHVYEPPRGTVAAYVDQSTIDEGRRRARATLKEKTRDMPGVSCAMVLGQGYRAIIEYAKKHEIDCIVLGSHRPGFSDFLLGSTAARVVRHADCDVLVCRSK